jgi:glycosyltransferase XagB
LFVVLLILGATVDGFYHWPRLTMTILVAGCMVFYIMTALLKLVITMAGRNYRPPRWIRLRPGDPTLPTYAVLLPVHKEANMLRHLVARVDHLVYPRRSFSCSC